MKKVFVLFLAAAVLCGLVFSAGCTSSDSVVGEWKWSDSSNENYYKFNSDGTGTYYSHSATVTADSTSSSSKSVSCEWKADGDKIIVYNFADDDSKITFAFDTKAQTLTNTANGNYLVRK